MVYPGVECPYIHMRGEYEDAYYECTSRLAADALAILREQEPVKPIPTGIEPNYNCGKCGLPIQQGYPFCPWCGKAVKWDDAE